MPSPIAGHGDERGAARPIHNRASLPDERARLSRARHQRRPRARLSLTTTTEQNGRVALSRSRIRPPDARDVEQGRAADAEAERLGSELSALRRIALLVARAAPEPELLEA